MTARKLMVFLTALCAFISLTAQDICEGRVKENAKGSFDELDQKLDLFFKDALTGKPIPDAKVSLRGRKTNTDSCGMATFPFPDMDEDEGYVYPIFEKTGYIKTEVPVRVIYESVFIRHFSISPALMAGKVRIVIDWGKTPADLDAHLIKKGKYHISFRDMKKFEDKAFLDRDDMDGYGPETMTINKPDQEGEYIFFIHDYTNRSAKNSEALGSSAAHVMVYGEEKLLYSFEVPKGKGSVWKVFEIKGGNLTPSSTMSDAAPK